MSDLETLYEGRWLRALRRAGWEYAERPGVMGIVILVAVTPERNLLFVEQHRPPVNAVVVEFPAGLVGDEPGRGAESVEEAARRELLEETGFEAGAFERLCEGPPSPGFTSEEITFLLARNLRKSGAGGGVEGEKLEVFEVPLSEAEAWIQGRIRKGRKVDPKVYAGLYFLSQGRF